MKKKLFAILLSIVMVAGLLPATALAAEPTVYDIWVDGVQVTSENKDNLFSGTVSYDPTTHTLSLNNATLDNDTMSDYGIKTTIPSTLKIRLTGTNSITNRSRRRSGNIPQLQQFCRDYRRWNTGDQRYRGKLRWN